ncbi:hypothetical protein Sjap_002329 [Stephania japonica]|uniref:Uncharacterized protein n=1 Tax=Stephania japonica TaxID=461633 RepID=A0AAP0KNG4_9MAGN
MEEVVGDANVQDGEIAMTDQTEPSDDSGAASPRVISVEDFQALIQRVATHDQRLEEILRILRMPVAVTPSPPSTSEVPVTQEMDTLIVATSTVPTTVVVISETIVLPSV